MIEIINIRTASMKEIAEYAETLPEEEQDAVFRASLFMQEER